MQSKRIGQFIVGIGLAAACVVLTSCVAVIPPRTIESAQQQFNDQEFVPGKTTVAEMQSAFGSPAEIKKEANGDKTYVYIKNRYSSGVTVDVGTAYVGEYTFDANGLFKEKNFLARPMSNPLIH